MELELFNGLFSYLNENNEDYNEFKYAYKYRIKKKFFKYKDRFKNRACPVCGYNYFDIWDHGVPYPERWVTESCENCGCCVGYADNCEWQDLWHDIAKAGIRSKKKILEIIQNFYSSNEQITEIFK